jgi:hypothetical protein
VAYGTNGAAVPNPVYQGGISFSGSLHLLPMLLRIDARYLSVAEIRITPSGDKPNFKVEINYYTSKP